MKISFVLPSRSRPAKFFKTLDNLKEFVIREDYEVVCVLDIEDETMNNDAVKERAKSYPQAKLNYTHTTGKVNAINKGLEFIDPEFQILILIADDLEFTMKGFDYEIEVDMMKYFPDLSGCLHYPDDKVGSRQITMPVLGVNYVKIFGWIYNPQFISVWCDNAMLHNAKYLAKYKYIPKHIFNHLHPLWTKEKYDELMKKNESYYAEDSQTYFKLLANNFDL